MFKFNNGNGAIVCDHCGTIISTTLDKTEGPHFCERCSVIDNFDLIKQHLHFSNKNEFYFLQIIQRRKDGNEGLHVRNGYRLIKSYYIYSIEQFEELRGRIVELCRNNNARAYINLNVRNAQEVALECIKTYSELVLNDNAFMGNAIWDSCCGRTSARGYKKLWVIDIDDPNLLDAVKDIILRCRRADEDPVKAIIPTASGFHMITSGFDTQTFGTLMQKEHEITLDIHKNNPTLLYYERRPKSKGTGEREQCLENN